MAIRFLAANSLGFYSLLQFRGALSTEGELSKANANSRSGSEQDFTPEKSLLHAATRSENRHYEQ
jgi:hypothetical protein